MKIGSQIKNSASNETFEIELESFESSVNLTYTLESLPLDRLIKDNVTINSTNCNEPTKPYLNCLQSTVPMKFGFCEKEYKFNLSYDYSDEYSGNQNLTLEKKTYFHSLSIKCNFWFFKENIKKFLKAKKTFSKI